MFSQDNTACKQFMDTLCNSRTAGLLSNIYSINKNIVRNANVEILSEL